MFDFIEEVSWRRVDLTLRAIPYPEFLQFQERLLLNSEVPFVYLRNDSARTLPAGATGSRALHFSLGRRSMSTLNSLATTFAPLFPTINTSSFTALSQRQDGALRVVGLGHNSQGQWHATEYGGKGTRSEAVERANFEWPGRLVDVFIKGGGDVFINCDTALPPSVNQYAYTKRRFRELLKSEERAVQVINLVMEHFFGPGDGRFISFVVEQLRAGVQSLNFTPGGQRRDFIYVDDVVTAILLVLEKRSSVGSGYVEVGLGSGEARCLRERVETIADLLCITRDVLELDALPYREKEPMVSVADVGLLKGLGWSPETSFEEGILQMLMATR